jgi:hypothetical protein
MRFALETLETRRMLSVTVHESEPNNTRATADAVQRKLDEDVVIKGKIATSADRDWFKIKLKAGDVLGAAVTGALPNTGGLDPYLRLFDLDRNLVIENDGPIFTSGDILPEQSPLPRANRSRLGVEFQRVIAEADTYYLEVSPYQGESAGRYKVELHVTRPALESAPRGTEQILFLDFDGSTVDWREYYDESMQALGVRQIGPLADALPHLPLTPQQADIDALISRITQIVQRKLADHVEANGLNNRFGITILNSRDHADPGDHPFVSRVRVGMANDEETLALTPGGIAQWLDVGNLVTNDEAVVFGEYMITGLQFFPLIDPNASRFEQVALGYADIICHEAGHIFGNFHTFGYEQLFDQPPDLMGSLVNTLGPDETYGTADDVDLHFGAVPYAEDEFFIGLNDTLNTISFGLTTGRRGGQRQPVDTEQTDWLPVSHSDLDDDLERTLAGLTTDPEW